MAYYTLSNGKPSFFPEFKEQAKSARLYWYADAGKICAKCKTPDPIRHVKTDECRVCISNQKLPHILSKSQAIQLGFPGFYRRFKVCKKGPHLHHFSVVHGRCLECLETNYKTNVEKINSRTATRVPINPCLQCGKLAPVDVKSRKCLGCHYNGRTDEVAPDTLKREDAKRIGFKFYRSKKGCRRGHEPIRYASAGLCRECVRENNNTRLAVERAVREGTVENG